jgi:hypothetical protein
MATANAYRLLDGLRSQSRARIQGCRRRRIAKTVQVQHQQDGSIGYSGILSCGSVWSCPVCATRVCMHRAEEVKRAVERWKAADEKHVVSMLTLTVRHARGHKLGALRRGLAKAWRKVWMGKSGAARKRRWGIAHSVRALEVTHSEANGWHPHLHIALFQTRTTTAEEVDEIRELWVRLVEKELGADHAPSWERGVDYRPLNVTDYLTKLGLEVSSVTKKGRGASRSPWQIAHAAADGDRRARALWHEYSEAMRGARQLFWSRNARRFFGLVREESEYEMAKDGPGYVLGEWDAPVWDDLCRRDPFWVSRVVAAATGELGGAAAAVARLPGVRFLLTPGVSGPPEYTWPLSPLCHSASTTTGTDSPSGVASAIER